jgi:hypothetical protein
LMFTGRLWEPKAMLRGFSVVCGGLFMFACADPQIEPAQTPAAEQNAPEAAPAPPPPPPKPSPTYATETKDAGPDGEDADEARKDSAELAQKCPTPDELAARQTARNDAAKAVPTIIMRTKEAESDAARLKAASKRAQARYDRAAAAASICAEREQANAAQVDEQVQRNPEAVQLVLSMNLCMRQQDERKALAAIAEEKQNAKIAGVVDLAALKELQDAVVQSRKASKVYRDALTQLKRKPLGCDSKPVTNLWDCGANTGGSTCDSPPTKSLLRLSQKLADAEDDE